MVSQTETFQQCRRFGFEVAQSSVAKYMVKRQDPPSQG
jgi:hypothetical protein